MAEAVDPGVQLDEDAEGHNILHLRPFELRVDQKIQSGKGGVGKGEEGRVGRREEGMRHDAR